MSRPPLDVTKALFDSDGYRHTLIQATPMQIVTLLEGFYWLWDRRSGRCLIDAMPDARLSNVRPSYQDMSNKRNPLAETRAFMLAQEAVLAAASSSWLHARQHSPQTPAMSATSSDAAPAAAARAAATRPAGESTGGAHDPRTLHRAALAAPQRAAPVRRCATPAAGASRPTGATMALLLGLIGFAVLIQGAG